MDARIKIAIAAWAASLAAACALLPLVEGSGWMVRTALLLAAVSGTGVLVRWRGAGGGLTLVCQSAVVVFLVTLVTAPEDAFLGLVPTPETVGTLGELFAAGAEDVRTYTAPAPLTDGIALILLTGVLVCGLMVDLLAVTLRSAAPAGLPLLALYSVAAGVSESGASWPYFLLAAAGFMAMLLSESRDRVSHWGRVLGRPGGHPGAAAGAAQAPRMPTGRRIGAVTLCVAALAPVALPSLGSGVFDLYGGNGQGPGSSSSPTSVNPVVELQNQLNRRQNEILLSYRTDSPRAGEMYLRLVALDRFDGRRWTSTSDTLDDPPPTPWAVAGLADGVGTTLVSTEISAVEDYRQRSLPVPVPAVDIDAEGAWDYDIYARTLVAEGRRQTASGLSYSVRSLLVEPTAEQLAGAPAPASEKIRQDFTEVPDNLPGIVHDTALEVTAGAANDYERAVALQDFFTRNGGFRYSTDVESGTGSQAIANFLRDKEGFCIHYAFTMAAMARTLGIPAQVSVGFTPGQRRSDEAGSYYVVGTHNAHAWPELYFEGVGWTRFEPTPGQGSRPSYTLPRPSDPTGEQPERPEQNPAREEERPAEERPEQQNPEGCDPILEPGLCQGEQRNGTEEEQDGGWTAVWRYLWPAAAALLLPAVGLAPMLWRRRLRRRRLAPGRGPLAAWQELTDTAWDLGVFPMEAETPRVAARRIVRVGGLTGEPEAAVHRLATAVERVLYAPPGTARGTDRGTAQEPPDDGGRTAQDVRTAAAGLVATADRWTRLRA
uniref:transglutaminase TgpA family protein n=1 Tax=Streptomyces sp. YIM 98790 TaxID=2689077 RepID=UPI00140B71FC